MVGFLKTAYAYLYGEGRGNPLQRSCLENPMDRGTLWARVHEVAELDTIEHTHAHTHPYLYRIMYYIFKSDETFLKKCWPGVPP